MWLGGGLVGLWDVDAGDEVTAEQMKALFGHGLHPNAEARLAALQAEARAVEVTGQNHGRPCFRGSEREHLTMSDALSAATGRPVAFYVREAVVEHLEHLEWAYGVAARAEAVRAGTRETVSLDEVARGLGFDPDALRADASHDA